jgi:DNA-binding response OmpR family regulator
MEEKGRIFLCEDDENLGMLLKEYLQVKDFIVDLFPDGEAGAKNFPREKYDLCILDVMMPKKDGFALAQEIRAADTDIPVIFLTAKTLKEDVLEGFKIGADDYISKPFSMEELLLRVEAILRRVSSKKPSKEGPYVIGKFTFDPQKQVLTNNKHNPVKLTTKESDLLGLLCENVNQVLERNYALKKIWGVVDYFNARSMDVYITKLRKLLKEDTDVEIMNIHGKGYKLIAPIAE